MRQCVSEVSRHPVWGTWLRRPREVNAAPRLEATGAWPVRLRAPSPRSIWVSLLCSKGHPIRSTKNKTPRQNLVSFAITCHQQSWAREPVSTCGPGGPVRCVATYRCPRLTRSSRGEDPSLDALPTGCGRRSRANCAAGWRRVTAIEYTPLLLSRLPSPLLHGSPHPCFTVPLRRAPGR